MVIANDASASARAAFSATARAGIGPAERIAAKRALGVDAAYASSIRQALPGQKITDDHLIQLRALGVSSAYIRGLQAAGLRNLDVDTVSQLRALRVTTTDADELTEFRALGRDVGELEDEPDTDPDPDDGG
jgi:hypothetical protein